MEFYSDSNDSGAGRYGGINLLHMEEMHHGLKDSDWQSMEWT